MLRYLSLLWCLFHRITGMNNGYHFNPRRACAARVTVVGSVCVSVTFDLPSRMSNRAINKRAYLAAYKRQKFRGDSPETTTFRSYSAKHERKSQYANLSAYQRSAFPARCSQGAGGCRAMIKSVQPCPKRYLLMQLARVAPRRAV